MKNYYQVITTPTADTPGSTIILHYPDKRYFFGQLSEGTQRACTERGIKITSLTDIFLTGRTEWANTGGMIGVILTLADSIAAANGAIQSVNEQKALRRAVNQPQPSQKTQNSPELPVGQDVDLMQVNLTIHGSTNLTHTLATARRFVFRKGMPLYTKEYTFESIAKQVTADLKDPFVKPTWSDSNIKVWALPIRPYSSDSPQTTSVQSTRKRSLDEFKETDTSVDGLDQHTMDNLVRQSVVTDMFNSQWRKDTLHEMPLADVSMPAALFVRNAETKDIEVYTGPKPGEGFPLPKINVLVRRPWPGANVDSLPPTSPSKEALCYIIRGHDIRGKFDVKKAKDLRVEPGPKFAALTRGESVQSMDGKTITSDMVLNPTTPGKGLAIMELPSVEYIESLLNRPEWKSPAVMTELKAFVWILGPGVGDHPKLREFVAIMSHCEHTVSSADYCPNYLALTNAASSAVRLALLKGDSYSIPVHDNVTLPQVRATTPPSLDIAASNDSAIFKPLNPGFIIDMEPEYKFNDSEVMTRLNTAQTIFRIPKAVEERMAVIRTRVSKPNFQRKLREFRKTIPSPEAEIIALGTGSSSPSKYRNVSATLIHAPGFGYYLLDCGENTLGQLERVFEPEQLRVVLQNLRMIWISHLHADHHLGTISVIKAWYRENYGPDTTPVSEPETDLEAILKEKRLFIVSDDAMISWLEEYAAVENYGAHKLVSLCAHPRSSKTSIVTEFTYRHTIAGQPPLIPPRRTVLDFKDNSSPLTPLLKSATGLSDILTTYVKHCRGSLALSLVFPDGFKISFSGDCRPSGKFASIGRDSTVLIHEATFQDDMAGSALAKRHSTTGEALEVGRRMNARSILLTHFSQRYQKVAHVDQRAGTAMHDNLKSSPKVEAMTDCPRVDEARDTDIPLDDPEEPLGSSGFGEALSDDIRFSSKSEQPLYVPGIITPVATAMDYMRVKVSDLPLAQAYAPALEKLIEVLERQASQTSVLKAQAAKKTIIKNKSKKTKDVPVAAEPKEPVVSAFSASESEDGWETSDYEDLGN
ncbi:transcriptional regulator family: bZIP [Penicillium taxi]|uniref:transcriptional regulator family: bZIP n=1 Tax=Penicillium taxi TaxID=168475 RepID=UPI0025454A00|nr:transcriptional regulator family: bZIP [Penicillium taxi]KAJ5901607.1 transcriptional regulator family: bZIP [Penicillium taxi]